MRLLQAHPDLLAVEREMATPEAATRPSATWLKTCRKRGLPEGLIERLAGFEVAWVQSGYARHTRLAFAETEKAALRADLLALHMAPPETMAPPLRDLVAQCFTTRPGIGIKAEKVGNAALRAPAAMPDGAGVPSLARILARTRYAKVREKINAALDRAAEAAGTSRQTLDEITVPDHEMAAGTRRLPVGPGAARFTLANGRIEIAWEDQD